MISLKPGTFDVDVTATTLPVLTLLGSRRPLVIGHRGDCWFAPENTLPSFKLAIAAGADLVELDYHHTRDGQLIVIHDQELDRTTDAVSRWAQKHIKVEARTAAELQSLDAGSWFSPKYAGTRLPLLAEALDTIQAGSVTLIERKAGAPADCISLLRQKRLINRVVVQAFDWTYLRAFHEQEPAQVLAALGPPAQLSDGRKPSGLGKELNAAWLPELRQTGLTIIVWSHKVSRQAVELAHAQGLKVWVYTINNAAQANDLLDIGVDGLITNKVSLIREAMALRQKQVV